MVSQLSEKLSETVRTVRKVRPGVTPMPSEIEGLLHWVYHTHLTHIAIAQDDAQTRRERQVFRGRSSRDGCISVAQIGELGVRVDSSASSEFSVPDVCIRVHEAILELGPERSGLVLDHATTGTRPDWMPDARPRLLPVMNRNNKPKIERDRSGNDLLCPLIWFVTGENIEAARDFYLYWWDALAVLSEDLSTIGLDIAAPSICREPWFTRDSKR